jgi:hypothetical protein
MTRCRLSVMWDGPNFRYEYFFHDFTPVGGYSRKVEAERKKYIAERNTTGRV